MPGAAFSTRMLPGPILGLAHLQALARSTRETNTPGNRPFRLLGARYASREYKVEA